MFDFSDLDFSSLSENKCDFSMPKYYNQASNAVEITHLGLASTLCFNRYWLIAIIKAQIDSSLNVLKENNFSQEDIAIFHFEIDRLIGHWFTLRDEQYPLVIGLPDHDLVPLALERRSQIIGLSSYAAMGLFVDLLLGFKRCHIDIFHTIDNRFEEVESTKSLFLEYIEPLIDSTLFSVGDFLLRDDSEQELKNNLIDIALYRFDNATFFYAKENEWINILNGLVIDKPNLSEVEVED